jgi:hypothetical protein
MRFIPASFLSLALLAVFLPSETKAQIGGDNTYEFLNLPVSARVGAVGGNLISVKDDDLNLSYQNPSLLDSSMHNKLSLTYVNYFGDVNFGYAGYARHYAKLEGTLSAGLQFVDYGAFTMADETGLITGSFKAGEYALNFGYGRKIDSLFSVGANLKTIYSNLAGYNSVGSAVDIAGTYFDARRQVCVALVVKNMGIQWTTYNGGRREELPFEVQLGFSKKPKHVPFRFSLIAQHLEKWDLTFDDPLNPVQTVDPLTGEEIDQNKVKIFSDKLMRHVVLGGEFLLTKNFNLRLGYNYQRRKELIVTGKPGLIGFSFGFGLKISKFYLSYGRASYHLAGKSNHFTITTNLSDFMKK